MADINTVEDRLADASGRIGAVLEKLYGSLIEPGERRAGLDALRRLFDVDQLAVVCRRAEAPTQVSANLVSDDTPRREYEKHYVKSFCAVDPFVNLPVDRPLMVQEVMEERAWESHEFVERFLRPMNVFHVLGADILTEPGTIYSVRLCRSRRALRFSEDDRALFRKMLPHLRRFGQVHARLGRARMLEHVLNTLTEGVKLGAIVLDSHSKVVHSAGLADMRLAERQDFYLSSGRLRASSRSNDQKLQRMLQLASSLADDGIEGESQAARFESSGGSLGITLRNLPLPAALDENAQTGTMVVFRDLDSETEISETNLIRLFGFTAAVARFARLLAQGLTIDEAAKRLAVSRNTLRTHLRALFLKSGTTRQSDLMRTLVSSSTVFC
jgi:DNA-binding CsgD family transcriptional regulator